MTTVAYRGGFIASDSCWAMGNTRTTSASKVDRLASGALLGQAGDGDSRAVVALLDKVKTFEKIPSRADLAATRCDFHGILVLPRGEVVIVAIEPIGDEHHHYDAQVWKANRGYAAVGSGADFALGAMSAGKSAADAVRIACEWDINSRLPVHVVNLLDNKTKVRKPSIRKKRAT